MTQSTTRQLQVCWHSWTDVDSKLHDERIITVREEPNLHIVFYQRDVPDGKRTPWKLLCFVQRSGKWLNMESKNQFAAALTCSVWHCWTSEFFVSVVVAGRDLGK